MSVQIENLTKIYNQQKALDNVSFEAKKGEVTGFLGPNGAGKTTTMKILSCFISQDSGTAKVAGIDTRDNPREVKRNIGYLPEHNPLYKDMYVKEYLNFVAGLHQIKDKSKRIKEMIDMTGLGREQHKKIHMLSKGYRQRVGLAQALIHDPKVLILDEPTSGLDPNQLADIRKLIRNLAKEKTVIFSTHIMQEVEALCKQVVIINQGKVVGKGDLQELKQNAGQQGVEVIVKFDKNINLKQIFKAEGLSKIEKGEEEHQWIISSDGSSDIRTHLFEFAKEKNLVLLEMTQRNYEAEDVFRLLTKQ